VNGFLLLYIYAFNSFTSVAYCNFIKIYLSRGFFCAPAITFLPAFWLYRRYCIIVKRIESKI